MKRDSHDLARELIACTGAEEITEERSFWLRTHLQECASCREYANAASQLGRALRSIPFAAGSSLVGSTQLRVRLRAQQLRQQQDRMRLVWVSCILLAISGAVTTPLLWQGFQWLGEMLGVSSAIWQLGFAVFWTAPALAASVLLVARGIHLDNRNRTLTE